MEESFCTLEQDDNTGRQGHRKFKILLRGRLESESFAVLIIKMTSAVGERERAADGGSLGLTRSFAGRCTQSWWAPGTDQSDFNGFAETLTKLRASDPLTCSRPFQHLRNNFLFAFVFFFSKKVPITLYIANCKECSGFISPGTCLCTGLMAKSECKCPVKASNSLEPSSSQW